MIQQWWQMTNSSSISESIKELARQFDNDLGEIMDIAKFEDGSFVFKGFLVKESSNGKWSVYDIDSKDLIDDFFLRSCALMSIEARCTRKTMKVLEIKNLDNRYWSSYSDTLIYKNNIKIVNEERYDIVLNKLEHSELQSLFFKEEITRQFRVMMQ